MIERVIQGVEEGIEDVVSEQDVSVHITVRALLVVVRRMVLWALSNAGLSVVEARRYVLHEVLSVFPDAPPMMLSELITLVEAQAQEELGPDGQALLDATVFKDAPRV